MAAPGDVGVYKFGLLPGVNVNREDLLGVITNVDPTETPWLAQAPKDTMKAALKEWITDSLATASTAGAIEGNDFSIGTISTPTRNINWSQIFRKDIAITETERAIDAAGWKDAYGYQIKKAVEEIARNVELTVFSAISTSSGSSTAARAMKTFENFLTTNVKKSTDYSSATSAGTATAAVMTLNDFNATLAAIFTSGGKPESVFCNEAYKRQISNFSAGTAGIPNMRTVVAMDAAIALNVDLFETDFGRKAIVLDRWVPQATNVASAAGTGSTDVSGRIFFLERNKARMAWLRPVAHTLIGKSGDSVRGIVVGEGTLMVMAEKAHGVMQGVNNKSATT